MAGLKGCCPTLMEADGWCVNAGDEQEFAATGDADDDDDDVWKSFDNAPPRPVPLAGRAKIM